MRVAADGRPAVALIGDGAFNMTSQVVATAVEYDLPAIWVVLNNYELGIERKGMERSYSRVASVVPLSGARTPASATIRTTSRWRMPMAPKACGSKIPPNWARARARRSRAAGRGCIDVPIDLSVGSYFTKGIDRAYPDKWAKSYPSYNLLRNAEG